MIVCQKLEQSAQLEAEKERVAAQSKIAKLQEKYIEIENENTRLETIEKARINGMARQIEAESEKESIELAARSKAEIERRRMETFGELLSGPGGDQYLELERVKRFGLVNQSWIVQSDEHAFLPLSSGQ